MDASEIKQLQESVGKAYWNMNLDQFADALSMDAEHGYTQDKFRGFQNFAKALSRFDAETLTKILNHAAI
jgi:hypothetical protein